MSGYAAIRTVNELFLRVAALDGANPPRPDAMLCLNEAGAWHGISSEQVYWRVWALAQTLLEWGIGRGERVALLSENRWEWQVTDFAVLAIGAVDVPIYPTLTAEGVGCLLEDSGSRVAVVSTQAQLDKVLASSGNSVEVVVVMDSGILVDRATHVSGSKPGAPRLVSFEELMIRAEGKTRSDADSDAAFDALLRSIKPEELATLIYTSGTTGEPKGVMLSHGNLASNTSLSTQEFGFGPKDGAISYLPLSHITARALDYAMFFNGAQVAYCPKFDGLIQALQQVKPTVLVGVPRVYEKVRHGVQQKSAASPVKRRIFEWAVGLGAGYREAIHDGKKPGSLLWKVANKLVYSKIHEAFGGRVQRFISGGAPLGLDTGNWFASVGISILEGYGLTETSPVIAIDTPLHHRMGTVGQPLPGIECKIAADGELLVRGDCVFQGYWKKPAETAAVIDADGWFATGDIGRIDRDGYLSITDRKKELLKTSGGKFIAPAPIEGKLKTHTLVAEAALVGDRRKFASVLICPNFTALEAWSVQQGIGGASRRELVADERVMAVYANILAQVNATLEGFEKVKRFRVVAEEWTLDSGELTPSMKLKRRVITERYAALVADLYADEATARDLSA